MVGDKVPSKANFSNYYSVSPLARSRYSPQTETPLGGTLFEQSATTIYTANDAEDDQR